MAILNHPFLGRISGKLGNLVIYQLNGTTIVREKPQWKKSYQPSALQLLYQQKFKKATEALRPLGKLLDLGYGELITPTRKGIHLALSQTLKSAMVETEEESRVNFEAVLISTGFVSPFENYRLEWLDERKIQLHWDFLGNYGNTRDTDQTWIVLYNPDQGIVEEYQESVFRRSQAQEVLLSPRIDLSGAFMYLSFYRKLRNEKLRFSNSVCVNLGTNTG